MSKLTKKVKVVVKSRPAPKQAKAKRPHISMKSLNVLLGKFITHKSNDIRTSKDSLDVNQQTSLIAEYLTFVQSNS